MFTGHVPFNVSVDIPLDTCYLKCYKLQYQKHKVSGTQDMFIEFRNKNK